MKDNNVFEYMSAEQTLGLGLFLNTITYSLVSDIKSKVFDPIFEEVFPEEYFILQIQLATGRVVDLGGALYEIFRWVNYATILYFFARVMVEWMPNPVSFIWLITPFVLLLAMKKMFVQEVEPVEPVKPVNKEISNNQVEEGDQITSPSSSDTKKSPGEEEVISSLESSEATISPLREGSQ